MTSAASVLSLEPSAAEESVCAERAAAQSWRRRSTPSGDCFSNAVARMTHDIRTPLNAVIGFADLMQREFHGSLGSDRYREYAGHIAECGARLLSVTEQTLLLAACAGGEAAASPEPVALADLVERAIATLEVFGLRERLAIGIDIDRDREVTLDPSAMRYALANLIAAATRKADVGDILTFRLREGSGLDMLDLELGPAGRGGRLPARTGGMDGHIGIARALLALQGLELGLDHARGLPWSARIMLPGNAQLQLL